MSNNAKRKAWVLDTETKGTGAQMVPLEKVVDSSASSGHAVIVVQPKPKRVKPVEPRGPRRFKVVDVMTRQVLAEDAGTQATVEVLEGIRSVVDVSIYVWDERASEWQALDLDERKALWEFRGRT